MADKYEENELDIVAEHLKAIAHPLRLKIIHILQGNPVSVGELAGACEIPIQVISGHLRKLNARGILKKKRHGRQVYYRVDGSVYHRMVNHLSAPS